MDRSQKGALDQEIKEHMMATHLAHPHFGYRKKRKLSSYTPSVVCPNQTAWKRFSNLFPFHQLHLTFFYFNHYITLMVTPQAKFTVNRAP
ncbi:MULTISPECIES: hypothetical protein [Paenibacillus]|uniref:Uncharacterized protein n=1 Tax=Paenibacillus lautus TaxID=1401 RepID=A0A1R1AVV7_PAELA|nr:hypothetical protein [Paenibacillus lautus]OME89705.1 hypothetical protein BK123_25395 [Paenibacillus lautus]